MNIAVIPARGGSKRIPRKNIKLFNGTPMIAWSIKAALESKCFDRVIVSTDDEEIADVARQFGAEVPFLRPSDLADDNAGTMPVIAHAIKWLSNAGESLDLVCCIYATAPFIRPNDLQTGLERMKEGIYKFAFAVTSYSFPIQRAFRIDPVDGIEMFQPDQFNTRSQDLLPAYHDAGQFYFGLPQAWLDGDMVFSKHSFPIILPRYRVQDIDDNEDWINAEIMMEALSKRVRS
jgi:pseudaminic acid cytidylyltransferase